MGIFIGFLIICKELKREDLSFFIEILKLKSYTESVKKEFTSYEAGLDNTFSLCFYECH